MSMRNAYLASINTVAAAKAHFGGQYAITYCVPVGYPHNGTLQVTAWDVTCAGRRYIVRVGETLPRQALVQSAHRAEVDQLSAAWRAESAER